MEKASYIAFLPIIYLWILLFIQNKKKKKSIIKAVKINKTKGDLTEMREMLRQYIGKICQFKCLEGEVMGEILEISDDAILVKTYNTETNCIINLNYISKVIEVPLNKKGKPKAIY